MTLLRVMDGYLIETSSMFKRTLNAQIVEAQT